MLDKQASIYMLTNEHNTVLYIGVSSDLIKRVYEHKNKFVKGFAEKYQCEKLVYYELHGDIYTAISREKQLKAFPRKRKEALINAFNPDWIDLYENICK